MMYLKRFETNQNRDLEISEAISAIKAGKNVKAVISQDEFGRRTSFGVEHIKEIYTKNEWIVIVTEEKTYILKGWDENTREIKVDFFYNKTKDQEIDLEEARRAVSNGDIVQACDNVIHTGNIVRFLGDDKFLTLSGSVYTMV